jgi:hypothetical protein
MRQFPEANNCRALALPENFATLVSFASQLEKRSDLIVLRFNLLGLNERL